MRQNYVISFLGTDRPGLIDQLSAAVRAEDGSWLESRSINLGGLFGGIVEINLPQTGLEALQTRLEPLSQKLSTLTIQPLTEGNEASALEVELSIVGADRPGIVAEVTSILSRLQVNIEEMETEIQPAPMSSELTFHMNCLLSLPKDLSIDQVQHALEALADDLMVDARYPEPSNP